MTDESDSTPRPRTELQIENEKIAAVELERFKAAINTKDDLVFLLLRFHLLSEHVLERIIASRVPRADRILTKNALSYHQKLQIVDAFDLVAEGPIHAFKSLNALRNRCSHERARRITREDVDRIGTPLGSDYQVIVGLFAGNLEELLGATVAKAYFAFLKHAIAGERATLAAGGAKSATGGEAAEQGDEADER